MGADQLPGDGQPQATASRPRPITPPEPVEDVGQVFGIDTRPVVRHRHLHFNSRLKGRDDHRASAAPRPTTRRVV